MVTIISIIPYISETNGTSSSLKKKNPQERKKKGKRDGKEEKKRKGMERVCAKGKEKGRMRCGKKEEKEEEKIERAAQEIYRPIRTHSLARS